jgi:hypothetical protein
MVDALVQIFLPKVKHDCLMGGEGVVGKLYDCLMGGEGVVGKLEPNTRTKGHLGAIISHHYVYFEWSKLVRWTWQNAQSAN